MKTTTNAKQWLFHFTITDLARILGKSPVTLRGWERQHLLSIPRDSNGDRRVSLVEMRAIARRARELKRITQTRLEIIESAITLLEIIERANIK